MNTSVKKLVLRPVQSDCKIWQKKVGAFLQYKVDSYEEWLNNTTKKTDKQKAQSALSRAIEVLDEFNNGVITNKVVNDYTYSLVRKACAAESQMKNITINQSYSAMLQRENEFARQSHLDVSEEKKKYDSETKKIVNEIFNAACRVVKDNPKKMDSLLDGLEIDNVLGGYGYGWRQELKSAFWKSVKDGLLNGKVSPPNFKSNSPFTVVKNNIGFSSDYDSLEETLEKWNNDINIYFDLGSNQYSTICNTSSSIAKFKIDVGNCKNRVELLSTLKKIYTGEYVFCGSSIQMDKADKKIILNLVIQTPEKKIELDEDVVVGVDVGVAIPAYCALNNKDWSLSIGNGKDFTAKKKQFEEQRKRLQRSITFSSGGHGRKKKTKTLDKFKECQHNFTNTYNHKVAKKVVDFAIKNKAKYINIEYLKGISEDDKFLKEWPYYDLQNKIRYKAERFGIVVRSVNPCYTSQICSICGCYHPDNRKSQSEFICENCGSKLNADKNAARNIARIPDALILKDNDSKSKETMIKEAQNTYGIVAE